ncbi:MAG: hypothetical protein HQL25_00705 [Candidatus Omnitrophica bacterium]|nr:hypothetical protein [Candidatus Omnitrophota bacterium]
MRLFLLLCVCVVASGCSTASGLVTLKNLTKEQKQTQLEVDKQDVQFAKLWVLASTGSFGDRKNAQDFERDFGAPILIKQVEVNGKKMEKWLYRNSTKFFDAQKVYLYFDEQKNYVKFDRVDAKPVVKK